MTAYESYRTMPWTSDSDECEADCGVIMGEGRYVEGDLGHYCSEDCRDECESDYVRFRIRAFMLRGLPRRT